MSDDLKPTTIITSDDTLIDFRDLSAAPPPAVFVVQQVYGDVKAVFASQAEAEAWLGTAYADWRASGHMFIERWELGPPQKERDE